MRLNALGLLNRRTHWKAKAFLKEAREAVKDIPYTLEVFETYRSQEDQYKRYAQGRTKEDLRRARVPERYWRFAKPEANQVTWTLTSRHTSRDAFDIGFKRGGGWTWKVPTEIWRKLIPIGQKYGLRNLAPREYAHYEDDGSAFIPNYISELYREGSDRLRERLLKIIPR